MLSAIIVVLGVEETGATVAVVLVVVAETAVVVIGAVFGATVVVLEVAGTAVVVLWYYTILQKATELSTTTAHSNMMLCNTLQKVTEL